MGKSNQKIETRGGRRPGSGRRPLSVSQSQIKAIHAAANKKAAETGKTLWDVCLDWIYDNQLPVGQRQAAWKMYADKYVIQASEGSEADKEGLGPAVYLPELRPRLELINHEKKDDEAA